MADDTPIEPSSQDLSRFVTQWDGESRPDLVPFWSRVREALAGYVNRNAIDSVLSDADRALIDDYESAVLRHYEEDDRLMGRMREELCGRIDDLDGAGVAREIARMDQALIARRDARANELVRSLSPSAAAVLLAEADKVARLFGGANTDAVALAKEFPDYVKDRYRAQCLALVHISPASFQ